MLAISRGSRLRLSAADLLIEGGLLSSTREVPTSRHKAAVRGYQIYSRSSRTCAETAPQRMNENDPADGTDRHLVPEGDATSSPGLSAGSFGGLPWAPIRPNELLTPTGLRPTKSIFGAVAHAPKNRGTQGDEDTWSPGCSSAASGGHPGVLFGSGGPGFAKDAANPGYPDIAHRLFSAQAGVPAPRLKISF